MGASVVGALAVLGEGDLDKLIGERRNVEKMSRAFRELGG
jgi:hypothetical protein